MSITGEVGENSSAKDAAANLKGIGDGLTVAFDEKAKEYATRIINGEDPRTMGVPTSLRGDVTRFMEEMKAPKVEESSLTTELSISEAPTEIDFGTTAEEIEADKVFARNKLAEDEALLATRNQLATLVEAQQQPVEIDFGTTAEEMEAEKVVARKEMAEAEKFTITKGIHWFRDRFKNLFPTK